MKHLGAEERKKPRKFLSPGKARHVAVPISSDMIKRDGNNNSSVSLPNETFVQEKTYKGRLWNFERHRESRAHCAVNDPDITREGRLNEGTSSKTPKGHHGCQNSNDRSPTPRGLWRT